MILGGSFLGALALSLQASGRQSIVTEGVLKQTCFSLQLKSKESKGPSKGELSVTHVLPAVAFTVVLSRLPLLRRGFEAGTLPWGSEEWEGWVARV